MMRYDSKHHQRNAKETRERKRGQISLTFARPEVRGDTNDVNG